MGSINSGKRSLKDKINGFLLLATSFLVVVFPNAFRGIKVLLFAGILIIVIPQIARLGKFLKLFYLIGLVLTIVFILIGLSSAKYPEVSTPQIIVVYIVSPLFWLLSARHIFMRYNVKEIVSALNTFAVIGCTTVFIGLWLFNNGYKSILEYIIDNPNQTFTRTGLVAIRFHVYGSLIFLIPGFFQLRQNYDSRYFFILILFIITAVVSGRDAFILAILVGFLFFLLLNRGKKVSYFLYIVISSFLLVTILRFYGVNLSNTFTSFLEKVQSGGGGERSRQFFALMEGINKNYGLGSGHGVGVEMLRSYEYPWRYEILPVATVFRVGIIGFLIYTFPLFYSCRAFYIRYKLQINTIYDNYFISGLISLCLASFTNPYLESIEFQWAYFFVFIYFYNTRKHVRALNVKI